MESRPTQKGMIAAIVFASVVVSGSLIFSSLAFTGQLSANVIGKPATIEVSQSDIDKKIQEGIDEYAKRKAAEAPAAPTAAAVAARTNEKAQNVRKYDATKDHVFGDAEARISLIEYSDFDCPYCKTFHATAKKLVENNGESVNWIYRHYPLPSHNPSATLFAVATECAADQKGDEGFWMLADAIFAKASTRSGGDDAKWVGELAGTLGLDGATLETCTKENKFLSKVQEQYEEGSSFGVNGTPGNFLVDNKTGKVQFVPGALPYERLKTMVDSMMAE